MKKVAIFSMGSRGDIQPYVYLAQALNENGYEVTIGTHPCWRKLVEDADVLFVPIGPDINIEVESAIIRGKTKNQIISFLNTMKFIIKIVQNSSSDVYKVCEGKDLVVVSHTRMGAVEADVLGIPTVNVTLQTEMIPERMKEVSFKDKMIGKMIAGQIAKPYNKIRKQYNKPKMKDFDEIMSKELNLIPISKYIKEPSPYWEKKNILTGYWYVNAKNYQPTEEIKKFLEEGEPPIILALGAMAFESNSEKDKLDAFVHAFEKTGMRAMIQGFQKTLEDYELPETMISISSVPHSWLFPKCYCVIHHCGFGTSSTSMVYGIPSIPVPHVLDQTGFAMELEKAGVAVPAIPAKELSEERIVTAIDEMKRTYLDKKSKALELSKKMQEENGLETAVRLIDEMQ